MCGCDENVVKIYRNIKFIQLWQNTSKKLSSGTTYKDGYKIKWQNATQEELAPCFKL